MPATDKSALVRNPLTIIAMFAGIAEISGTVVLPLLDVSVQSTYVWFLMLFPPLLVIAFFGTLIHDSRDLYAPSDYQNEDNFQRKWSSALPEEKLAKVEEEISDVSAAASTPATAPGGGHAGVAAPTNIDDSADAPNAADEPNESRPDNGDGVPANGLDEIRSGQHREASASSYAVNNYLRAEQYVLDSLRPRFAAVVPNVKVETSEQTVILDGIAMDNKGDAVVIEVLLLGLSRIRNRGAAKGLVKRLALAAPSIPRSKGKRVKAIVALINPRAGDEGSVLQELAVLQSYGYDVKVETFVVPLGNLGESTTTKA